MEIRWREGGRNKSLNVHGSHELAKKILRKKLSARDENRHFDVKREINFPMSALIARRSNAGMTTSPKRRVCRREPRSATSLSCTT